MKHKITFILWLGDIFAVFLFLLSVHWQVWSQIDDLSKILLGLAFILLFVKPKFCKFSREDKEEKKEEKS